MTVHQKTWPYLVIGGGLAGLTSALHLPPEDVLVLEKNHQVGGVCRSVYIDGFTFDYTGHLLHFKHPENYDWVKNLLGEGVLKQYHRRAFIYVYDRWVAYPFQINLFGLPPEVIYECLHGFIRLIMEEPERHPTDSFKDWVLKTFGDGIARHFMFPYNQKFWCRDLDELTTDWVSWAIPRPELEDILKGALGIVDREYGYNPVFYYPSRGGIQVLPQAMARRIRNLETRCPVHRIHWQDKYVETPKGKISYNRLIATQPLPDIVDQLEPPVEDILEKAQHLRYLTVVNFNLGIRGEAPIDAHWIYFPEERFVFYRVGFASRFSPNMAPPGTYSLYVEISVDESRNRLNLEDLRSRVIEGLKACGLLNHEEDILVEHPLVIRPAYVVFDRDRQVVLPEIRDFLVAHDIYPVGRYAEWDYYSMDDTMYSARQWVDMLKQRDGT